MELKYKCQKCGIPLGFDGLCWKCRMEEKRKEVDSWNEEEIKEKIEQVINKMKSSNNKKFYSTDECKIFNDLMTRGVDLKGVSETAIENEIYYPAQIYYKAGEEVRDKLIEKLMNTKSSEEGSELLCCLAMVGDKKSQDTLYELKVNPKSWRRKLYVDSDVYAEEGGWTFDSKNNYIKLNYDKCFSFEKGEKKDEEGTFIARKRGEKCHHCGCEMIDILVIDGKDERFSFLDLDGIITASCCPNCITMTEGISNRFTLDGKNEILEFEGTEENYCNENVIEQMLDNKFKISEKEKPLFYGAFTDDINTIGGFASWIQDWEYRECPECGKKMKYLAQIHWDTIMDWAEGTLFIEICPDCKIITMFHQQT